MLSGLGNLLRGHPHLRGGRGLVAMRTKVDREGGGLAMSGQPFQCGQVSKSACIPNTHRF